MKIKLVDVDNRLSIKYNKSEDVYNWGADNCYPQLIKSLINSSVTAKQCVDLNAKYIYGKGFDFTSNIVDKNTLIINKRGININQLLRIVSREFSEQNNLFLHINFNALYEIISVDLLTSEDVRIGKSDSTGYSGKFIVYDNWSKDKGKKIEKKDFNIIDKYNPLPAVIEAQVEAAGGWNKYKGQVLHINSDFGELYSLSDIDSVIYDANAEHRTGLFKNELLTKGYTGSKFILTKPMDYAETEAFGKTLEKLQGVDNIGMVHFQVSEESDVLANELSVLDIASNLDDKMFVQTEISSAKNIRKAFGVPSILIEDGDNSIFGNSGELVRVSQQMHWENKEEERNIICDAFQMLFSKFHKQINPSNDWNITPIIQKPEPTNE
ncbi:phage portal protein [Flavobacterium sp. Sr18]|uniref:phage portal protein n=1 Tax=Flavobacterium sp. Sr18 TaxID=935222 RepID=UPI0013E4EE8F|nr:phage portal protein [Flavobacterium sp. Sr18]QIH37884.1 phage portal protein [Flavobacterium sp. Sr18]